MKLMRIKMKWAAGIWMCILVSAPVRAEEKTTVRINLEQAIAIALSDNPTIVVAEQGVELKKVARQEALAGLLPSAELSGVYSRTLKKQTMVMEFGGESTTIQVGSANSYNGGITVSLPVFAPALYRSINLTQTDIELAVEKARSSKLDMVNQVTKAYYQLLLTQDSYEVLQKSYAQAEANFNVVNERYKLGSVSEYDKIRADVQVRNIKPNVVSARNGMNLAKLQLKVLMGLGQDTDVEIEGNLANYEQEMTDRAINIETLNLAANSDLKQLDLNKTLLEKTLHLQKANFLPTLGASFSYSYISQNEDFKIGKYKWFPYSPLSFSLTIPLFKGSNFTKIRQTKIQISQLQETRLNTERQLYMQVSAFLNNMSASSEQLASNREGVLQAEKGRMIAQKRYEIGKGTILELNDAEVALTQSQLTYSQSIYDYLTAKADLEKILGTEEKIIK